jgi:putative membrane protein
VLIWLKRLIALVVVLAVFAFGVFFTLSNTQPVALDLYFIRLPEQYLALWVLSAFAVGGLIGMAISSVAVFKLRASRASLRRKLERRDKELAGLRTSPVK